jgi:hypothetical protein
MKIIYTVSFALLFFVSSRLSAQSIIPPLKPTRAIYLEAGGAGLSYSFNFDSRFKGEKGWGWRGGLSYISRPEDLKLFSAPLQVNYLLGSHTNFIELGAGLTYFYLDDYLYYNGTGYTSSDESELLLPVKTKGDVMATFTFGFRHQPKQGIMYRFALTPVANSSGFWPLFAGASFGYSF